ncbi:MAG: glycosyltransferase family 4 protein [Candidatus Omnitrophota bacterium]
MRMKIALISLQFEETATGGGGVHVKSICDQFLKCGEDVTVISIHTNKTLNRRPSNKFEDVLYSVEKKGSLRIIRFLIDEDIDQPYVGSKDTELARILRFSDVVLKWLELSGETFDIINLHGHHIIPGYMAMELKKTGSKVVSTIHALETTYVMEKGEFVGAYEGTKEVLKEIREWEAMCRYADHVVVNSPIVRDEFEKIIEETGEDSAVYNEKIVLISSGCNEDFLMTDEEIKRKLEDTPETVNLITFCRVDPSKGIEFSINGAKEAARMSEKKFCLTIAGIPASEEYISQLKKEAKDVPDNLEIKFDLLQAISPDEEKKHILDDKHIYILPTLKEPFGMSIIEASARGNMIVSADTNGPRFMFEIEKGLSKDWGIVTSYGVLARITDNYTETLPKNIAEAIIWTINNRQDGILRVVLFNDKIRQKWTWKGIAGQYLELFAVDTN